MGASLSKGDRHARGAAYLGGYAVECKIKAVAMEVHRCRSLTELADKLGLDERSVFTHGLEALVKDALPSGYSDRLLDGDAGEAFRRQVNRWRPSWRYDPQDWKADEAGRFLQAVETVCTWIGNNR